MTLVQLKSPATRPTISTLDGVLVIDHKRASFLPEGRAVRLLAWWSLLAIFVFPLSGFPLRAASTWTQDSFEDFRAGTFLDAGSNAYVSRTGRIQIISRWDLNGDGHLDLVLPSGHAHSEKENTFIYLNRRGHLDGRTRVEIPGGGSRGGLVADLNRDGLNDLVVVNHSDSHFDYVDTWIFWGTPNGYSAQHRTKLPAFEGRAVAAGDFNGDSWLDLAIACKWHDLANPERNQAVSVVYWNSPDGFVPVRRLELPLGGETAASLAVGNLDGDKVDDLVVQTAAGTHLFQTSKGDFLSGTASERLPQRGESVVVGDFDGDGRVDLAVGRRGAVTVLRSNWGRWALDQAIVLPVTQPRDLCAADVNLDGCDDLIVANYEGADGASWVDSLVFYSDRGDFSPDRATRLPTLGASGVNAADLNGDGFPELVVSNLAVVNQRDLESYVFWNRGGEFRFGDHTQLPTSGSMANAIGDVDHDGEPDIVFFNDEGGFRDGPSETHVYWGDGTRAFSPDRRTVLPSRQVFGHGHADLDDDGFVDLILTKENFLSGITHEQSGLRIHWGSQSGFAPATSEITAPAAYGGVRIADLNRDGHLDIVSGGANFEPGNPAVQGIPIYWGAADGFSHRNITILPSENPRIRGPLLADLNRDGWLDIAAQERPGTITIWRGSASGYDAPEKTAVDLGRPDPLMYLQAADFNRDGWLDLLLPRRGPPEGTLVSSLILFGSPEGFQSSNSAEIPSYVPYQNSIADLDRDGWLDLVLTSYGGEVSGNRPSLIYWGGPNGFMARPRTELPTHGSSGSMALDFDDDGWLDLFFANHRSSGSIDEPEPHRHLTVSMLYWGGAEGFSPARRWDVPSRGPSGLNLRDPGNMYDRGLYEDYLSSPFEIPAGEQFARIDWSAETPLGTAVHLQVRVAGAEADLARSPWVGPDGGESWWTVPGSAGTVPCGRWIQYRARLLTPNGGASPYLSRVSLSFE